MVVVVIIGILAAVAIPSYNGFQDKAKAAEAKVVLGAIYSAEKAFFAEWTVYTSDLVAVGVAKAKTTAAATADPLDGSTAQYYTKIGFKVAATGVGETAAKKGGATVNNFNIGGATAATCIVNATGTTFQVCAEGTGLRSWFLTHEAGSIGSY